MSDKKPADLAELAYEDTLRCVQCGYCLPACPTYEAFGTETHSPRGRIRLVRAAAEGKLANAELLAEAIDRCLGCRACETACPSGVDYGRILNSAKAYLAARRPLPRTGKLAYRKLLPYKRRMNAGSLLLWVYQSSGLRNLAARMRIPERLGPIGAFEPVLPKQPSPGERRKRPSRLVPDGPVRRKVAMFGGCVMDAVFGRTNWHAMRVLQAAGCEVVRLDGETCCGALHAHAGEGDAAVALAKRNIEALEALEAEGPVDYVVNSAGGCGAMLQEYDLLFPPESEWAARARSFANRVRDFSAVLAELPPLDFPRRNSADPLIVTYQPSCHMTHVQRVTEEPVRLLMSIPGIELRRMTDADKCCGSAGVYNIVRHDDALRILERKMKHLADTRAAAVVVTNPGCFLQLQFGIRRLGLEKQMSAVHLADLLAERLQLD
jgi:glycolate oxidase iron-sulfur subunit